MSKKLILFTLVVVIASLLSGCATGAVRGTSWPGLATDGDVAYLADGAYLYAVNLKDGKELWQFSSKPKVRPFLNIGGKPAPSFIATPAITSDGLIIVGSASNNYTLYAIDPKNIDPDTKEPVAAWTFTGAEDHWIATPLIIEDLLFAPNSDGNLYIFDLSDGQTNKQPMKVIELGGRLWGQPVTDGQRVYVTSLDHKVFAIEKDSYKIAWDEDLGSAIPSAPVLAEDGSLYLGSFNSQLEKFDPASGNHRTVEKTNGRVWGTPSLVENNLYFGDLSGNFYSFNIEEGKYNWAPIQPDAAITASPLMLNDMFLVATESGSIYEVDKEGHSKLWSQPGGKIYTTPVLAGDLVLVSPLGADGYLYAYDLNGHLAWPTPFKPGN